MLIDLQRFITLRPYLYHLTASENVQRIVRTRVFESAASLMTAARDVTHLRRKRREHRVIGIGAERVVIRDQSPLHAGNIQLEDGRSIGDIVQLLNERVFFWPGGPSSPNACGERHFEKYRAEDPAVLRVRTSDVLADPRNTEPEFCRFNSGSPRWSGGRASPRGPSTFAGPAIATCRPSAVVEVTFVGRVHLPEGSAEYCRLSEWAKWQPAI